VIDWLLVDYGEVLSTAPPEVTFTELTAIAGLKRDEFFERHWPEPMARMPGGIRAQPGPHVGVRVGRGLRDRQAPVGGTGKPNRLARQPFRHAQRVLEHVHGAALGGWAQNFPFATSRKASFSTSAPASSRLSRAFCSRSSLSSLAASVSIPP
jgi:hypothetical protein